MLVAECRLRKLREEIQHDDVIFQYTICKYQQNISDWQLIPSNNPVTVKCHYKTVTTIQILHQDSVLNVTVDWQTFLWIALLNDNMWRNCVKICDLQ
jgi:hypothetical protein